MMCERKVHHRPASIDSVTEAPSGQQGIDDSEYTRWTLLFVYACIIYAIIGFSWGALMGGIPVLRMFVDTVPHGHLIVLAHGHKIGRAHV